MKNIQNYLQKISVIILFIFTSLLAETPDFIWTKQFGSTGNEYAKKITRDRNGNFYVAGEYNNAFDFGGTNLKFKDLRELFLAKFAADGDLIWVKSIIGSGYQSVADVACDNNGNCFLIGGTNWTIYFDSDSLPCWNDHGDVFVLKFNSTGKLEWSMKGHGAEIAKISACATDEKGNCYITGGGELIHFKNKSISGPYIVKISGDGNSEWARSVRSYNPPGEIAVDGYANSYLIANRYEDVAIFKYNAQGDTIWTRTLKGGGISLRSIACDYSGNSVITGSFESSVTIGTTTLASKGKTDMFITKMDSKGAFLWAKSGGGSGTDKGLGISMDKFSNIFVTGYMAGNATFDQTTLSNPQGTDLFVACYDKDGNLQWVKNSTGTGETAGEAIVSDGQGYCAITGAIERTIDFSGNIFTSKGQMDIFVTRLGVVPKEVTVNYEFKTPGWYLVSLPVTPTNTSVSALFPTAAAAYRYESSSRSYQVVSNLAPQNGYWLLFSTSSSATISGLPVTNFSQNYTAGWHLIGTVTGTTNFSAPDEVPDGAVLAAFGWQTVGEQYVPIYPTGTQKLDEKQGYWLAVLQDCQLSLPGESVFAKNKAVSAQDYDNFVQTFGAEPPPPPFATGVSTGLVPLVKEFTSWHFPNPFNPMITIEYYLPHNGKTSIVVYNSLGQQVRQLVLDYQEAGKHQITWDARNEAGEEVSNGIYLYRMMHNGNSQCQKIMLLK